MDWFQHVGYIGVSTKQVLSTMTDQTADDADNIFFGISRLHERGHGDGFEKLLSEQHWCCGRGQGEAGTSMSIDPVWGHDGVARSRPTMVATGAGEVHHWGRRRVAHQVPMYLICTRGTSSHSRS